MLLLLNDPINPPRHPMNRSHEDYKNTFEEQEHIEHIRNTYAIVKEWMEEDEVLALASKLGLNSNVKFISISLINKTHPSLEETLDETNLRDINPWEILENKISNIYHKHEIIETNLLPIDNHEETPLEFEKVDHIVDHVNYFIKHPIRPMLI